jgi:hypothetical protein
MISGLTFNDSKFKNCNPNQSKTRQKSGDCKVAILEKALVKHLKVNNNPQFVTTKMIKMLNQKVIRKINFMTKY